LKHLAADGGSSCARSARARVVGSQLKWRHAPAQRELSLQRQSPTRSRSHRRTEASSRLSYAGRRSSSCTASSTTLTSSSPRLSALDEHTTEEPSGRRPMQGRGTGADAPSPTGTAALPAGLTRDRVLKETRTPAYPNLGRTRLCRGMGPGGFLTSIPRLTPLEGLGREGDSQRERPPKWPLSPSGKPAEREFTVQACTTLLPNPRAPQAGSRPVAWCNWASDGAGFGPATVALRLVGSSRSSTRGESPRWPRRRG
jgi:hypothetical protein